MRRLLSFLTSSVSCTHEFQLNVLDSSVVVPKFLRSGQPLYNTNTGRRRMVLELKLEPNRKEQADGDAGQVDCRAHDTSAADPKDGVNAWQVDSNTHKSTHSTGSGAPCSEGLVHLTAAEAEVHRQLALRGRASVSALPVWHLGQAGQVTEMMRGRFCSSLKIGVFRGVLGFLISQTSAVLPHHM